MQVPLFTSPYLFLPVMFKSCQYLLISLISYFLLIYCYLTSCTLQIFAECLNHAKDPFDQYQSFYKSCASVKGGGLFSFSNILRNVM